MDSSLPKHLVHLLCTVKDENFIKEEVSSWLDREKSDRLKDTVFNPTVPVKTLLKKFVQQYSGLPPLDVLYE
jgi:hypothetical protein